LHGWLDNSVQAPKMQGDFYGNCPNTSKYSFGFANPRQQNRIFTLTFPFITVMIIVVGDPFNDP
jgi:hypothetical protein